MAEPIEIVKKSFVRQNFLHLLMNELPEESKWIIMGERNYLAQGKIYDIILQLEQDVLRKVLVKKGVDSDEYKFFMSLTQALYQAGEAVHLVEKLNEELVAMKEYNEFLHQRNAKLEVEATRWKTIEELSKADLLQVYTDRVKQILEQEKEKK